MKKDPPDHLFHLFSRPQQASDSTIQSMRKGATSYLRFLDGLEERLQRSHENIMSFLYMQKEILASMVETELAPLTHSEALQHAQNILNCEDIDHQEE